MRTNTHTPSFPKLLFSCLFLISFLGLSAQCNQAINGFTYIGDLNNSAYYLSNAPAQPMQAQTIAMGLGGHLVSINSLAENRLVQAGINEMTYIGLNDRQSEGNVGWNDGSTLGFTNYDSCAFCQDNDAENDYALMHPWNGGWSFSNRYSERNYVIEVPCDDTQGGGSNGGGNNGQSSNDGDCASSYQGFQFLGDHGESNYFISNGISRPADAQASAAALGGYLVTIDNQAENDFISAQIDEMVYIGLSDANSEGSLTWVSGENASYRNIDENCGFCADNNQENDYTLMHPWNGQWSYMNQWSARRYIMEVPCNGDGGNNNGGNNNGGNGNGGNNSTLAFTNCPADRVIQISPGQSTAFVNWTPPTLSSTCIAGGISVGLVDGPGNNTNLGAGSYTISYRGANNCGDQVMCEFTITVMGSQQSSSLEYANCPADINSVANGSTVSWSAPNLINNCAAGINSSAQISGPQNNTELAPGNYTVRYRATNNCGDEAICEFDVNITLDNVPTSIEISCPANRTINIPQGQSTTLLTYDEPSAINICDAGPTTVIIERIDGLQQNTTVSAGIYIIRYSARNLCGDMEECAFQITVNAPNVQPPVGGQVNYTANDQVTPYTGVFRPGTNVGYNPPWTDEEMASLAAGDPAQGVKGIGARTMRPGLFEFITDQFGYDFRLATYEHYASLGLEDLTMIVGFPSDRHRDQTDFCGNGFNSAMFRNLYTDIWDDGTDGTPYNDENFYAAYLYEVVSRYGEHVKFWEIWNEPGFDLTGNRGWRQPGDPIGNWWDNDPDPCEYILRAPIEHYVRTLRISWEIIKTLQPDDYVAVAGVGFVSFLDAILRNTDDPINGGVVSADYPNLGGAYFDVMGFHSYPDIDGTVYEINQNGERIFNRHSDEAAQGITKTQDNYQEILDNYGYDGVQSPEKEWIITEINVPRRPFRPMAMSGGEEMQVNYIIKAVAAAMKNDIRQMHVYNLGDETSEGEAVTEFNLYGLHKILTGTFAFTQERNLEAIAYKSAADFVFGSRYDEARTNQMNLPANLDGIALRLPNGRYKYMLWAKTTIDQSEFASGSYSFPASFGYGQVFRRTWNFTDTDQVSGISSNNITLSGRPIFITETANPSEIQTRRAGEENFHLAVNEILPNPAVDEIKLVLQSKESDNYDIQIYDATGKLVKQRNTFIEKGVSNERFDISNLSHGMYFIMIQDSNMRSTKVKFVKVENLD